MLRRLNVSGLHGRRAELLGLLQIRYRAVTISGEGFGRAAIVVRVRICGAESNGLGEVGDGLLHLAEPKVHVAAGVTRRCKARIEFDCLNERTQSVIKFALVG